MKIRESKASGLPTEIKTVSEHVSAELLFSYDDDTPLQVAQRRAMNAANAFARLIDVLASNGVLSLAEVSVIASGYDRGLEPVSEEDSGG